MRHPFTYTGNLPHINLSPVLAALTPDVCEIVAPSTANTPATSVNLVRSKVGIPYMLCPQCGKRTADLYAPSDFWACRTCCKLRYTSASISGRSRSRFMLERLAEKAEGATTDDEREYVTARIAAHTDALAPRPMPRGPSWYATRRYVRERDNPHDFSYPANRSPKNTAGVGSQTVREVPEPAYRGRDAVARAIIEQNANRPTAPQVYKELAQHTPPVQPDALEREQVEQQRIEQQYRDRGCEDAYYPRAPALPDGDVPPVILPHRDAGAWLYDAPPSTADAIRRWHEW